MQISCGTLRNKSRHLSVNLKSWLPSTNCDAIPGANACDVAIPGASVCDSNQDASICDAYHDASICDANRGDEDGSDASRGDEDGSDASRGANGELQLLRWKIISK
ncbi:MAG: hypothetical protein H0T84_09740 [Tatlockia sp.]|nr:hypothetical protein [Tatlockia sp.]